MHVHIPDPSRPREVHGAWAATFPDRSGRLGSLRRQRLLKRLEQFGPPGEDDRFAFPLWAAQIRAHLSGLGMIVSDGRSRPEVQVIVQDPSTGHRHHLSVPPRFGDPSTKTYRQLGTAEARIRAAIAWTFGLKPDEYAPALEA